MLDLTDDVKKPDFGWDDYYAPAKAATTVNGRVRALPALIDDLAVVYNKKLFKEMGVTEPPAGGWTWDQFVGHVEAAHRQGARARSAPRGRRSATRTPCGASGRSCGRRGGDIITEDGKAGFGGAPGEQAFGVVDRLAQDGSVYVDTKPDSDQTYQLFNNGKIGMVVTGPWQLPDFIDAKIDFGVAPLPTFGGEPLTISAPDTWTLFDNGKRAREGRGRVRPVAQLARAGRAWVIEAGSLPLRKGTAEQPEWKEYQDKTPGLSVFLAALDGARTKPTNPLVPAGLRGRSGSRSSRCCSSAPRRRTPSTQAVQGARRGPRRRRLIGGWQSPSSGRRPAPSGCSARRRPPGCGSCRRS